VAVGRAHDEEAARMTNASMGGARDRLPTERANPDSAGLDALDARAAFDVFQRADEHMVGAVGAARDAVCAAIDLVAERLARGGRLLYVGAGTSGRLGVLDAAECPPTFGTEPERVQGVVAGGAEALLRPVEGAEDDAGAARAALEALGLGPDDVVFGITAGGTTAFVHAAVAHARAHGAATVFLACVPFELAPDAADVSIRLDTGPEVLAGSTRLKAGSATKLVLNRVSTLALARLGKVHGNLMVDVDASANAKLVERATSLVATLTGLEREPARALLERAGMRVKTAVVMHARGLARGEAERVLAEHGGVLALALEA
jgi:N-acetylmuramic acid 6-phosphate etherase